MDCLKSSSEASQTHAKCLSALEGEPLPSNTSKFCVPPRLRNVSISCGQSHQAGQQGSRDKCGARGIKSPSHSPTAKLPGAPCSASPPDSRRESQLPNTPFLCEPKPDVPMCLRSLPSSLDAACVCLLTNGGGPGSQGQGWTGLRVTSPGQHCGSAYQDKSGSSPELS